MPEALRSVVRPPGGASRVGLVRAFRGAFAGSDRDALRSLADLHDAQLAARLHSIAAFKRLTERYLVDPRFRERFEADPVASARRYGIDAEPEDLKAFRDVQRFTPSEGDCAFATTNLQAYLALHLACLGFEGRNALATSGPCTRFSAWRARQHARHRLTLYPLADRLFFPVFGFELSRGCSVGCWFCGLSADRLRGIWPYDEGNAATWRALLEALRRRFGPALGASLCYWATDPLDNPDYERFVDDFWRLAGAHPSTVTALAWREPERTSALLRTSAARGCFGNQFSVPTVESLERIHSVFGPEELLWTQLVPLSRDAYAFSAYPAAGPARKVRAGRALAPSGRRANEVEAHPGTIACVTGFLVNAVERRVELVAPVAASERWPRGYEILGSAPWHRAEDLAASIDAMIETHMPLAPPADSRVGFRPEFRFVPLTDGFEVVGRCGSAAFRAPLRLPGQVDWLAVGLSVNAGVHTPRDIARRFAPGGVEPARTFESLERLFDAGVLEDAPATS